jgi:hypothetical protein
MAMRMAMRNPEQITMHIGKIINQELISSVNKKD